MGVKDTTKEVVVIDFGTKFTKFGLSNLEPNEMPTVIIKPRLNSQLGDVAGKLALKERRRSKLEHPIKNGEIVDSDGMEKIIVQIYHELSINPEEFPATIGVSAFADDKMIEKIKEIFTALGVTTLKIIRQPVLAIRAAKKSTGIVIEMGDGVTQIVPIYENEIIQPAIKSFPISGSDLTNFLMNLLNEKSRMFVNGIDEDEVREIKDNRCRVALNEDKVEAKRIVLSDGKSITIDDEITKCPEALFTPSLMFLNSNGLHDEILDSITKCDETIQDLLLQNIVLSGGASAFPNLSKRLEMELKKITKSHVKVEGIVDGKFAPWIGGSLLA